MKRSFFAVLALASLCQAAEPVSSPKPAEVTNAVPKELQQSIAGTDRVIALQTAWEAGDRKSANRDLRKWMKTDPKSPWPWVAAANLKYHEKKYGGCISMADGALKRDPNSADGYYWRGRCLESEGKTLEAANEYGAALEAQPLHLAAQEGRNRLRAQLGETSAEVQPN